MAPSKTRQATATSNSGKSQVGTWLFSCQVAIRVYSSKKQKPLHSELPTEARRAELLVMAASSQPGRRQVPDGEGTRLP